MAAPQRFGEVSALRATSAGHFAAEVSPEWTIAGKPNGGYLLAMLGRAAVATCPHDDVLAASAHYLHSPDPGPVTITAELLRAGRSASQVRARMEQDGRPCVEAFLFVGRLDPAATPFWAGGLPDAGDVGPDEGIRARGGELPVALLEQVTITIDPATAGFMTGEPAGGGALRGWLTLPHDEAFDPISLLFAVDAFPPGTFEIEFAGWVPTFELTAYVRALPAPGPVRILQQARLIDGQRFDEACFVWDTTGRLVAQSTQLAGIRLG